MLRVPIVPGFRWQELLARLEGFVPSNLDGTWASQRRRMVLVLQEHAATLEFPGVTKVGKHKSLNPREKVLKRHPEP